MSKEKQLHIEPEILSKLSWVVGTTPYVYYNTSYVINFGILYELQKEKKEKIEELLGGKNHTITSKDVLYVLPTHPTPLFKIKEYCKQIGCTITNNLSKATVILGHNNLSNKGFAYNQLLYFTDSECPYTFEKNELDIADLKQPAVFQPSFEEIYKYDEVTNFLCSYDTINYLSGYKKEAAYKKIKHNLNLYHSKKSLGGSKLFCQPYTVYLLYKILERKLPVVSLESLNLQFNKSTVIDKELYETLLKMFKGSHDDKTMAVNIVTNCNINASLFYLMELGSNIDIYRIIWEHKKFKHVREFIELSNFFSFCHMSDWKKFDTLVTHNKLLQEQFKHFYEKSQKHIIYQIEAIMNTSFLSEIFDIKISINQKYLEEVEQLQIQQKEISILHKENKYYGDEQRLDLLQIIKKLQNESITTT